MKKRYNNLSIRLSFVFLFQLFLFANFSCSSEGTNDNCKILLEENKLLTDSLLELNRINYQLQNQLQTTTNVESRFFDYHYYILNNIHSSSIWTGDDNKDYQYRLLFSSIAEVGFIHAELLTSTIEEVWRPELVERIYIEPEIVELPFFRHSIEFIEWTSPQSAIIGEDFIFELNIPEMEATRIEE